VATGRACDKRETRPLTADGTARAELPSWLLDLHDTPPSLTTIQSLRNSLSEGILSAWRPRSATPMNHPRLMTVAFLPCAPQVRHAAEVLFSQIASPRQREQTLPGDTFARHCSHRATNFVRFAFFARKARQMGQCFGERRSFDSEVSRFRETCLAGASSSSIMLKVDYLGRERCNCKSAVFLLPHVPENGTHVDVGFVVPIGSWSVASQRGGGHQPRD
jgi:hypothetical protein